MALQSVRHEPSDPHRQRLYRQAILIAIAGNVLLTAGKGATAWLSGSSAVFSDAANSFSDALYSLLMAVGLYLAQQPADESHPQGHSRFEPLVSLFIAAMLAVAGFTALREGWLRFLSGANLPTAERHLLWFGIAGAKSLVPSFSFPQASIHQSPREPPSEKETASSRTRP